MLQALRISMGLGAPWDGLTDGNLIIQNLSAVTFHFQQEVTEAFTFCYPQNSKSFTETQLIPNCQENQSQ